MFKEGKGSFIFSLHNKEAGDSISINNHPSLIDGVVLTVLHSPLKDVWDWWFGAGWYILGCMCAYTMQSPRQDSRDVCMHVKLHVYCRRGLLDVLNSCNFQPTLYHFEFTVEIEREGKGKIFSSGCENKRSVSFVGRACSDPTQNGNT